MTERLTFNQHINQELLELFKGLAEQHPELTGMAIAVTYAPELGDIPNSFLVICDQNNPESICRLGVQAARLQQVIGQGIGKQCREALAAVTAIQQAKDVQREPGPSSTGQNTP